MKNNILKLLLFSLILYAGLVQATQNQLQNHPSPYLAMHGDDPVHWQSWTPELFKRAKQENKLVFVSIGYFACHWCHVMQKESYRNAEIAKIINDKYIAVKVDRELQPALDARLIDFVEKTRGYAGWPLNVFITPEGYPLLGVVYMPPSDFKELLQKLNTAWHEDLANMKAMAEAAADEWRNLDRSEGDKLDAQRVQHYRKLFEQQTMQIADHLQGGFGEENKFPMVPQLNLLLDIYVNNQDDSLGEFIRLTMDRMASQGMNDQLRSGFYRYVVDPNWQTPHFEKMLYDNAQLISLYSRAGKIFNNSRYHRVANDTAAFMLKELNSKQGLLISSLSAIDDKGVEGGFYLWSDDELAKLLSKQESEIIRQYWGMENAPTLEAGHHPRISASADDIAKKLNKRAEQVRLVIGQVKSRLRQQQTRRVLPRDGKLLASWNALALSALSQLGTLSKSRLKQAEKLRDVLVKYFVSPQGLRRAWSDGQYLGDPALEDYAYVAQGLLDWSVVSNSKSDRKLAARIIRQAWKKFYNEEGWILSENLIAGIETRQSIAADGPMPSPSASLIRASLKLAELEQDKKLYKQAVTALNRGHHILKTDNFWYATHIAAMLQSLDLHNKLVKNK